MARDMGLGPVRAPTRQVMIPDIGSEYVLARDWKFQLFNEWRNQDIVNALGLEKPAHLLVQEQSANWEIRYAARDALNELSWPVTLPKGTKLRVDRVYIRQGASDFSSLSFYIESCPLLELTPTKQGGGFKKGRRRFWAKLPEVNQMNVESTT